MAQNRKKPGADSPMQGEGNYDAARRYDEKLRDHVQNHDVEREARDAEPSSRGEERELERAEDAGRQRAKEEDRLLDRPDDIGRPAGGKASKP
jgi:hypothetical protein